jgi:hypothetical protein
MTVPGEEAVVATAGVDVDHDGTTMSHLSRMNTYESALRASKLLDDQQFRSTLYMPSEYDDDEEEDDDDDDGDDSNSTSDADVQLMAHRFHNSNNTEDDDQRDDDRQQQLLREDRQPQNNNNNNVQDVLRSPPSSPRFVLQRCLAWSHDDDNTHNEEAYHHRHHLGDIIINNSTSTSSNQDQQQQQSSYYNYSDLQRTQSQLQPMVYQDCVDYDDQYHRHQHHHSYSHNNNNNIYHQLPKSRGCGGRNSDGDRVQYLTVGDAVPFLEDGLHILAKSRLPVRRLHQSLNDEDDQMMWVVTTPSTETLGLQLVKSFGSYHSAIIDSVNSCEFLNNNNNSNNNVPATAANTTQTQVVSSSSSPLSSSKSSSFSLSPGNGSMIRPIHWEEQVTVDKKLDTFFSS